MKYERLKKLRWLCFALAAIGIVQTPFVVLPAIPTAISDHRFIFPFAGALVIRFLVIGFLFRIWWKTGKTGADSNQDRTIAK
jgi:hypothetical protein